MQLEKIKHVALDMDGTIYLGDTLFPYTLDFLDKLKRMGISYSFLTNNPSKSIEDYLKKLARMGIHATEEEIYNTTVATIDNPHNICEFARQQNLPFAEISVPDVSQCPGLPANYAISPYDADILQREKSLNYSASPSAT